MKHVKSINIDPRFQINYSSFYIFGLKEIFGGKVHFSLFKDDALFIENHKELMRGFPVIILYEDNSKKKVFFDLHDSSTVNEDYYEWSDVYAKINVETKDLNRSKIFVLGPSFGIRLWSLPMTLVHLFINYFKIRGDWTSSYTPGFKFYLSNYLYQWQRRRYYNSYHCHCKEDDGYIFSLNTLWYDPLADSTTNTLRGVFIKTAKKFFPRFEGGFYYLEGSDVLQEFPEYVKYKEQFKDCLTTKRCSMDEYLEKIKKSMLVFNTPSVRACHGWKLGEYLAMGKCILSTPLSREMPGVFEVGKHYYLVNDKEDISKALKELSSSPGIIQELKRNASIYFEEYLTPSKVIERLFNRL